MSVYCNARELLAEVSSRYRAMVSYSDVGVVRPSFAYEPLACWFETQYESPNKFRFQFIRPHPYRKLCHHITKYIAGCDDATAYFYTENRGCKATVEIEDNLEMAIAGATGISQGTAHTIGCLLLDCVGGFTLPMMNRLRFRHSRVFDDVLCHRVSGIFPPIGRFTVWIGVSDLLLRKVVNHRHRKEEVRFRIAVNRQLNPEVFCVPQPEHELHSDKKSIEHLLLRVAGPPQKTKI